MADIMKALGWALAGYVTIWYLVWRWGPNRSSFFAGPFREPGNRIPTIKHAAGTVLFFIVAPIAVKILGIDVADEYTTYYLAFIAGTLATFLHILWLRWG